MHVIITGASGFVGSHLVQALAIAGHSGVAVSRRCIAKLPDGWRWISREDLLEGRGSAEIAARAPDWVVHLEVKQHVLNPTPADCAEFESVNVEGTCRWLDWCAAHGVMGFAYFSTIKAVGDSSAPQSEESATEPTTYYGQSKRKAEAKVSAWVADDARRTALILRPAVVYGPGNRGNIFAMVEAIDRGRFLLVDQGRNIKSLVSIRNLAAALVFLLDDRQPGCRLYNIVDRHSYAVREVAAMVTQELATSRRIRSMPAWLAQAIATFGDGAVRLGWGFPLTSSRLKALRETTQFTGEKLISKGFVHPQPSNVALAEMTRWYLENRAR